MAYLAESDGIRPDARRVPTDAPALDSNLLWWRSHLTPLYTRLVAQYPQFFAAAGGARQGSGAAAGPSPSSSSLPPVAPTTGGSTLAFRAGDCSCVYPVPRDASTSHLSATVAGFEQRDGGGPTHSIYPVAD